MSFISVLNWNSIISLKIFWSFKNNFSHAFALKKTFRWWNLGIKWCSNCCNCFIIFMTPVWFIQVNYQMRQNILSACGLFSSLRHYYPWFTFHVDANGLFSFTEKHNFGLTHQSMRPSKEKSAIVPLPLLFTC